MGFHDYNAESLIHDPVHGYIPFISRSRLPAGEISEQDLIDHPWVQRMRNIHQLQTAWWVFPSAEHTRFQHILGAMHLASQAVQHWYPSLCDACRNVPSQPYVEALVRLAALLHDVGHGPFGHFFDDHHLDQFGVTHEDIGATVIVQELGDLLSRVRRSPGGQLQPLEQIDPQQIGWLIRRPRGPASTNEGHPDWLCKLRSLFSGIYTVDNMDFVLRDAYMAGISTKAFDLSRLLHYSFFTPAGLTIHARGLPALISFIEMRASLFRTVYFHRTVRALDLAIEDVFAETMRHLFPGNPLENLDGYLHFHEASFLVDVQRWSTSTDPELLALGQQWQAMLCRQVLWRMACERTFYFHAGMNEQTTILSEPEILERRLRQHLPGEIREIPLRLDVARHFHRPGRRIASGGQNFVYDPGEGEPRELAEYEMFRSLPLSFSIVRIYAQDHQHDLELNRALQAVLGATSDAKTNM